MPNYLLNRWHGYHVIALFIIATAFVAALTWYNWKIGVIGLLILAVLLVFTIQAQLAFKREFGEYIATISSRVSKASEAAVQKLPIDGAL